MADFNALFLDPALTFSVGDPVDFSAVFMPLPTTIDDTLPVASSVTLVSAPITRLSPIVLQVDDDNTLRTIFVNVAFPEGTWEAAYDGSRFAPRYASSTLVVNSDTRMTLTLRREQGWPMSPTVSIRGIDGSGNLTSPEPIDD